MNCLYVGVQEIMGIYQWGRAYWQPLIHYLSVTAAKGHT